MKQVSTRPRNPGVFPFIVVCVATTLLLACPSGPAPAPSGDRPTPSKAPDTPATPDAGGSKASGADAGPAKAKASPFRYEATLPLEGTVRFELAGTCRACKVGNLEAEARVEGEEIWLEGEVVGCEGDCRGHRLARGEATVRKLRPGNYTVRSEVLRVTKVVPLSLGPAKRTEWAMMQLERDCTTGLRGMTGTERGAKALVERVGGCLSKVPPQTKLDTVSSMMGWKNNDAYVPVLIEALNDTKVGYLAARILGRVDDERAVGPLIEALGSSDESLRWDASRSLEMITEQELGQDQARWRAWYATRKRR